MKCHDPKISAKTVCQNLYYCLKSSRSFTERIIEQCIELASDLHLNFDDISKEKMVMDVDGPTEKTEHYYLMLADHGRCAESKSKEVLEVLCNQARLTYITL